MKKQKIQYKTDQNLGRFCFLIYMILIFSSLGFLIFLRSGSLEYPTATTNLHFSLDSKSKIWARFSSSIQPITQVSSPTAFAESVRYAISSPIKVTRGENYNSVNVENLYPCGEGCGYAGGISSAGADGKKVAYSLALKYGLKPTK